MYQMYLQSSTLQHPFGAKSACLSVLYPRSLKGLDRLIIVGAEDISGPRIPTSNLDDACLRAGGFVQSTTELHYDQGRGRKPPSSRHRLSHGFHDLSPVRPRALGASVNTQ
jgi:hypothetical protein